uniref:Uncharacterized protein n=1 Tax=Vombatus ursinus TaxID=29139 RepID=A0A4X2L0K7_VOMUR
MCLGSFIETGHLGPSTTPTKPTVHISGVIARGDKDSPSAAAQMTHQRTCPSMEKHPSHRTTQQIQQPPK